MTIEKRHLSIQHSIQSDLLQLFEQFESINDGQLASYIPELAKQNPAHFSISVMTVDGKKYSVGAADHLLTLQSISKPFVYGLALEDIGREKMRRYVGVEPTGEAFNSIIELEEISHRPYNPMVNSGAIAVSGLIAGENSAHKFQRILEMFSQFCGRPVTMDESVFKSERSTADRNRAIAYLLKHFGKIDQDIEETLDLYFQQCSILMNTQDMAAMAATLANKGVHPQTHVKAFSSEYIKDLLSLMFTCGMYDSSGEWAYTVGIPAKSGVSGGIIGVIPGVMGIAVTSPLLDEYGHSVRGSLVFKELSQRWHLNLFEGVL